MDDDEQEDYAVIDEQEDYAVIITLSIVWGILITVFYTCVWINT